MSNLKIVIVFIITSLFSSSVFAVGGDYDFSSNVKPSTKPPAGLANTAVPQFIVIGCDDNALGTGLKWVLDLIESKKNPQGTSNSATYDGQQITMSFFCNSQYFYNPLDTNYDSTIVPQLKRAYGLGCEIANHTKTHLYCLEPNDVNPLQSKRIGDAVIKADIDSCNNHIINLVGVKASDIKGFRTPYLAYTDSTFIAIKQVGFTYDCSIEDGSNWDIANNKAGNYNWPYTLDTPPPGNDTPYCWWNLTYNTPVRIHTGQWELPCYFFNAPPDDKCVQYGLQPGFIKHLDSLVGYESDGKITGLDYNLWADTGIGGFRCNKTECIAVLKYTLDQMYKGNRTPFTVGIHSQDFVQESDEFPTTTPADRQEVLTTFLNYALDQTKFPDVRIVSGAKAIAWCMKPVPLVTPIINTIQSKNKQIALARVAGDKISIMVPEKGYYSIALFSVDGKLIKSINNTYMSTESYTLDYAGNNIGSKVYMISVIGKNVKVEQKLILQ